MIGVVTLWNQVQTTAKAGTSGYQSQNEFNADLDTVQKRIANVLCDNYDASQKVEDALFGLLVTQTGATNSTGVISTPNNYYRLISVWVNVGTNPSIPTPASKIASNQISAYATSYVRKPSVTTNDYSYYYLDSTIQMMPKATLNCTLVYCKTPPTANIVLTPSSDDNSDYITPTAGTDLIWSPILFNLFLYMMLEMLGVEMRDNIIYEFSQLGIPKEAYIGTSLMEGK